MHRFDPEDPFYCFWFILIFSSDSFAAYVAKKRSFNKPETLQALFLAHKLWVWGKLQGQQTIKQRLCCCVEQHPYTVAIDLTVCSGIGVTGFRQFLDRYMLRNAKSHGKGKYRRGAILTRCDKFWCMRVGAHQLMYRKSHCPPEGKVFSKK